MINFVCLLLLLSLQVNFELRNLHLILFNFFIKLLFNGCIFILFALLPYGFLHQSSFLFVLLEQIFHNWEVTLKPEVLFLKRLDCSGCGVWSLALLCEVGCGASVSSSKAYDRWSLGRCLSLFWRRLSRAVLIRRLSWTMGIDRWLIPIFNRGLFSGLNSLEFLLKNLELSIFLLLRRSETLFVQKDMIRDWIISNLILPSSYLSVELLDVLF